MPIPNVSVSCTDVVEFFGGRLECMENMEIKASELLLYGKLCWLDIRNSGLFRVV